MNEARRPLLDHWLWDVALGAVTAAAGLAFVERIRPLLAYFVDDVGAVFSALVGLHSSILGFVLAALSITAGYAQSERFKIVRDSGQLANLYRIYIAAAVTELGALSATLIALVTRIPSPFHETLALVVAALTLLAVFRLSRTVWITGAVVHATAGTGDRKPGER